MLEIRKGRGICPILDLWALNKIPKQYDFKILTHVALRLHIHCHETSNRLGFAINMERSRLSPIDIGDILSGIVPLPNATHSLLLRGGSEKLYSLLETRLSAQVCPVQSG